MKIQLQYGTSGLPVEVPDKGVAVVAPRYLDGLADEAAAFRAAVRSPIACAPLKSLIASTDRLAVVIPDITRPLPTDRLLTWLFEELAHVPPENVVIINGTGSHRPNTEAELASMVGAGVATGTGEPAQDSSPRRRERTDGHLSLDREYVEADKSSCLVHRASLHGSFSEATGNLPYRRIDWMLSPGQRHW
jgi:hypothetical protein